MLQVIPGSKAASDADGVVAIAKEAGFKISVDDLKAHQDGNGMIELSEGELEGVSGGTMVMTTPVTPLITTKL